MWSLTLLAAAATAQNSPDWSFWKERDNWWETVRRNTGTGNGRIQTVDRPEPIINYVDR